MQTRLHTSEWVTWDDRGRLPMEPGIYLISKGQTDNVIYVGKTIGDGGLRGRIRAFHRSATTGQKGHAGGVTFSAVFGPAALDLFVSVHVPKTINPAVNIMGPYLEFAERYFIWQQVEKTGELPVCNHY